MILLDVGFWPADSGLPVNVVQQTQPARQYRISLMMGQHCGLIVLLSESFTPDARPLAGESPEVGGYFVSCGYNSAGVMLSGGFGQQVAEWIVRGTPSVDMSEYDIRLEWDTFCLCVVNFLLTVVRCVSCIPEIDCLEMVSSSPLED